MSKIVIGDVRREELFNVRSSFIYVRGKRQGERNNFESRVIIIFICCELKVCHH
jgi:hypothetical protein